MKTPKYSDSDTAQHKLRSSLNGQIRSRSDYKLENVSAIWHVSSCKGVALPACTSGVFYPQGKTQGDYKQIVFVTEVEFNNWAEENNLTIMCKWVNENHVSLTGKTPPSTDSFTPNSRGRKSTYQSLHNELWDLVADVQPLRTIAYALGIGLDKATRYRHKMRIEQAQAKEDGAVELKTPKRVRIGS